MTGSRRAPRTSTRHFMLWYRVHRWTSLVCTLSLLVLCITGLPLVLKEEIGIWTGTTVAPPVLPGVTARVSVDQLVADARARRPGDAVRFVSQDDDAPAWFVSMGKTADAMAATAVYKYDARTGALLHDVNQSAGVMRAIQNLHENLFAGLPGTLFIGFMGVMFVASTLSGIVIYGVFMRAQPFGTVRVRRAERVKWLDLHNLLGIATACWLLVVGTTGVINTLALPMLSHWQSAELAALKAHWHAAPAADGMGSVQRALEVARAAAPGMDVAFVGFPGSRFTTPRHYMVFMRGDTALTSRLLKPIMIDAQSGKLVAAQPLPWYLSAVLLSQPLHFGDYGGLALKIIWIVFDLIAIGVLVSGLYLWWARRAAVHARLRSLRPEPDNGAEQ